MKIWIRWRDNEHEQDRHLSVSGFDPDDPDEVRTSDLQLDDPVDVYACETAYNEQFYEELDEAIRDGTRQGEHQVIEACGLTDRLDYRGTIDWVLLGETPEESAWLLEHYGDVRRGPYAEAIKQIQEHRRQMGQLPLAPEARGWSEQDVIDEAERIRKLNWAPMKARLLR